MERPKKGAAGRSKGGGKGAGRLELGGEKRKGGGGKEEQEQDGGTKLGDDSNLTGGKLRNASTATFRGFLSERA